MPEQAFTKSSLARMIRPHDFKIVSDLEQEWQQFVETALQKVDARQSFTLSVTESKRNDKIVFKVNNFSDELLVRKTTENLKRVTRARQQDRDAIIANLHRLLEEGVSYRIYRLDIRDFFGSVDVAKAMSMLHSERRLSRPTIELIEGIIKQLQLRQRGLPRGLELSSTFAEYVLTKLDAHIRDSKDVFFYSRFVDDMVIITSGNEEEAPFLQAISDQLAQMGLEINQKKNKKFIRKVTASHKEQDDQKQPIKRLICTFNFLGYEFKVFNPGKKDAPHAVEIDISPDKVRKIKTKITIAFLDFLKNRDFSLLFERISLLAGNYYVRDKHKLAKRTAGIFYSYRHANASDGRACAAFSLDVFFRHTLLSGKGKISSQISGALTNNQKRLLLKNSFVRGYKNKIFRHFNPVRLSRIMECWKYV